MLSIIRYRIRFMPLMIISLIIVKLTHILPLSSQLLYVLNFIFLSFVVINLILPFWALCAPSRIPLIHYRILIVILCIDQLFSYTRHWTLNLVISVFMIFSKPRADLLLLMLLFFFIILFSFIGAIRLSSQYVNDFVQ